MDPEGHFARLVDTLSAGRDDSRLAEITLDVFRRIQSHPRPEQWLEEQRQLWRGLDDVAGAEDTPWGGLLLDHVARQCAACARRLRQALALCGEDELLEKNYAPSVEQALRDVETLEQAAKDSWDGARACLPITFAKAGAKRKREHEADEFQLRRAPELTELVKALREAAKKQLEGLAALLDGTSDEKLEDMRTTRPAVLALLDLVQDFSRAYSREKDLRCMLDFGDLEHLSVRLLRDEN